MKVLQINWSQFFCVLIRALVILLIDQYPRHSLIIATTHGSSQIGPLPDYARGAMIIYVVALDVLFIVFLYSKNNRAQDSNPSAERETDVLQPHSRKPSGHTLPNILFCLLILPFVLPVIIRQFSSRYVKQIYWSFDNQSFRNLDDFAYLTSPLIVGLLFACALPILAYYGVFSRCLNFLRSHFGKRL